MNYSFNNFESDIDRIIYEIRTAGDTFDYIVGVLRGGILPAVRLSHKLPGDPEVVSLSWSHNKENRECNVWIPEEIQNGKKVLLMDDIIDTGRTTNEIINDWGITRNQIKISCLILNTYQDIVPDYYGRIINRQIDKDWINFWWEQ